MVKYFYSPVTGLTTASDKCPEGWIETNKEFFDRYPYKQVTLCPLSAVGLTRLPFKEKNKGSNPLEGTHYGYAGAR